MNEWETISRLWQRRIKVFPPSFLFSTKWRCFAFAVFLARSGKRRESGRHIRRSCLILILFFPSEKKTHEVSDRLFDLLNRRWNEEEKLSRKFLRRGRKLGIFPDKIRGFFSKQRATFLCSSSLRTRAQKLDASFIFDPLIFRFIVSSSSSLRHAPVPIISTHTTRARPAPRAEMRNNFLE